MSCTNLGRSEADRVVALLDSLVVVTEELYKAPDTSKCVVHSIAYDWSIQAVYTQYLWLAEKIAGETMDICKRGLPLERLTRAGKFQESVAWYSLSPIEGVNLPACLRMNTKTYLGHNC